jgi:PAS domain S-box-containing protein
VEWRQVGLSVLGPLLTLAVAIGADLLARRGVPIPNPVPLLMASILFAALRGGLPAGLVSALLTVLYAAHYYSGRGAELAYRTEDALSLAAVTLAAPLTALLAVRRTTRRPGAHRALDEAAARRAILRDVAARIAATSEVEATLQSVARALVPALGDSCLLQLTQPNGTMVCAGSAHVRPQQDLLTRTLCERGWPDARPGTGIEVVSLGDDRLGPGTALVASLAAGEETVGRMVLVRGRGREHTPAEAADAIDVAGRIGLAVAHARLLRDRAELEARSGLLFDANPEPMWVFDVETLAFLDANEAALRRYGYDRDELLRMSIMDLLAETDASPVHGSGADRPGVARARHRRRDGSILDVELTSHELTFHGRNARLVLAHDVTERMRTLAALHDSEDQLRRAQRTEAIGMLATGIAHDFNDLLTAVQGYSELLAQDIPADDPRRRDLDEISRAAGRGSVLTRQLLAFGKRSAEPPRAVDPNAAIDDLSMLFQRLAGSGTRLSIALSPDAGPVWIDPGRLEQVLVNMILYAREALAPGGELVIETSARVLGVDPRRRDVKPGRYVAVTVTCDGTHPDNAMAHPSGLGLSIVYNIVREAGGVLRVLTEPGQGTMLRIYLPRYESESESNGLVQTAAAGQGETVMVVEDEEGVRELVRRVLLRHGYRVLEARHGREALSEAERHPERIDLLLTDVVMPEMSGLTLAAALRERRPDLRVLFMSGYTPEEILRRANADPGMALLQKPFAGEELARVVRASLDAPAESTTAVASTAPAEPGS